MKFVLCDRRQSLASQVVSQLEGIDLQPGEMLKIERRWSNNENHLHRVRFRQGDYDEAPERVLHIIIECYELSSQEIDSLLSLPVKALELYHKSRYTALHRAGIYYVGQLVRMWENRELGRVKGIGRDTQASRRIKWVLNEKGLALGLTFPCGPKEMEKLKKVPTSFLFTSAMYAYMHSYNATLTKEDKRKIQALCTSLARKGISSFYDFVHAESRKIKATFKKVYFVDKVRREFSNQFIGNLPIVRALESYMPRYGFDFNVG